MIYTGTAFRILAIAAALTTAAITTGTFGQGIQALDISAESEPATVAETLDNLAVDEEIFEKGNPDAVVRKFMLAMMLGDARSLRKVSLPNKELDILSSGNRPPASELPRLIDALSKAPIKRLAIGDKVELGKHSLTISEKLVNDKRKQLVLSGTRIPFDVVWKKNGWRVEPRHLIAARKSAEAQKLKMEAQQAKAAAEQAAEEKAAEESDSE